MSYNKVIEFKTPDVIPKNTMSCEGCPYWKHLERIYFCKDLSKIPEDYSSERFEICPHECKLECFEDGFPTCWTDKVKCEYLGLIHEDEMLGLNEKIKQCGIGETIGEVLK